MPIPAPQQTAIVAGEYFDTIVVHAPSSGYGADGHASTAPGAAGAPLACSVQEVNKGAGTARTDSLSPFGEADYEIVCPADPGVSKADQLIEWTGNKEGAISPPVLFYSNGAARKPRGFSSRFTISASTRA